jgi:hypothetical protein
VPGQTVDATPSDMKLFSKVVFMKQGRRGGLARWEQFGKRRNQEEKEKMKEKV